MEAGHRDELVQDAPFLGPPALAVSLDDRRHEFIPRRHAHPPHRYLPDPIRVGSISDEATAQHSGTFLTRQCGFSSRSSRLARDRSGSRSAGWRVAHPGPATGVLRAEAQANTGAGKRAGGHPARPGWVRCASRRCRARVRRCAPVLPRPRAQTAPAARRRTAWTIRSIRTRKPRLRSAARRRARRATCSGGGRARSAAGPWAPTPGAGSASARCGAHRWPRPQPVCPGAGLLPQRRPAPAFFLDRQSWLARLLFQGGQVGIRVAAEAGAQGPGLPPAVETLAECGPSLAADPTQLARGGWAQPRRRGRDQAHLPTEHSGRGGRLAPAGPALVVALRAEQMLEVVVGAWQAGYRVTNEQPGFVAASHLAEVPDGVGERPRLAGGRGRGGDEPVKAAPDKAGVLLASFVQDVRGPVPPAVGARDVRP